MSSTLSKRNSLPWGQRGSRHTRDELRAQVEQEVLSATDPQWRTILVTALKGLEATECCWQTGGYAKRAPGDALRHGLVLFPFGLAVLGLVGHRYRAPDTRQQNRTPKTSR